MVRSLKKKKKEKIKELTEIKYIISENWMKFQIQAFVLMRRKKLKCICCLSQSKTVMVATPAFL